MSEQRQDWVICGRLIGTADGWDQADTFVMTVYNLIPVPELWVELGSEIVTIGVDFENGTIDGDFTEDGVPQKTFDLVELLSKCRKQKIERGY